MLAKSKIAFSLALLIATASAAMAAPRHAVRQPSTVHATVIRQLSTKAFLSFGSAANSARVAKPTYMTIQDIGFKENLGG